MAALSSKEIEDIFTSSNGAQELATLYHVDHERPAQTLNGALDFLTDVNWGFRVHTMYQKRRERKQKTYQFVFDQPNPWQASSRAHHAVDLIMIFGGIDLCFNSGAVKVGQRIRQAWIDFAYGEDPWSEEKTFAFGPFGTSGELTDGEYRFRRRVHCYEKLQETDPKIYQEVNAKLAGGRISLLN